MQMFRQMLVVEVTCWDWDDDNQVVNYHKVMVHHLDAVQSVLSCRDVDSRVVMLNWMESHSFGPRSLSFGSWIFPVRKGVSLYRAPTMLSSLLDLRA